MYGRQNFPTLVLVAGDDYFLNVEFKDPDYPKAEVLSELDEIELVINYNEDDAIRITGCVENSNLGSFYIPPDVTDFIGNASRRCHNLPDFPINYSVHIYWNTGGRNTPIYNAPIRMVRCREDYVL